MQVSDGGDGKVTYNEENKQDKQEQQQEQSYENDKRYTNHLLKPEMLQELLQKDGSLGDDQLGALVRRLRVILSCVVHPVDLDNKNVQTLIETEGCLAKFVELLNRNDQWELQVCVTISNSYHDEDRENWLNLLDFTHIHV